ncbi:MAG: hypothetical protein KF777_24490 [Planctomycetaceae bacterium]|nr:hypothetical protein [Planctomycetaceae bacterium]
MTITDIRVISACGTASAKPVFDFEVKNRANWRSLCSKEWVEGLDERVLPLHFKNGRRMAWVAGKSFDERPVNNFAMAHVDWTGCRPFTLFGDVIVRIRNRLWPVIWVPMGSAQAREDLHAVDMEDVAVLSTSFIRPQSGCLIAAKDTNRLAMAKLAVG